MVFSLTAKYVLKFLAVCGIANTSSALKSIIVVESSVALVVLIRTIEPAADEVVLAELV